MSYFKFNYLPVDIQKCICIVTPDESYYNFRSTSKWIMNMIGPPKKFITVGCTETDLPEILPGSIFEGIEMISLCDKCCTHKHKTDNRILDKFQNWISGFKNLKNVKIYGKMGIFIEKLPFTVNVLTIETAYIGKNIHRDGNLESDDFRDYAYGDHKTVVLHQNIQKVKMSPPVYVKFIPHPEITELKGGSFVIPKGFHFKNITNLNLCGSGCDIRNVTYPPNLKVIKFFWFSGIDLGKLPISNTTKIGISLRIKNWNIQNIKKYNLDKAEWLRIFDLKVNFSVDLMDLSLMKFKSIVCDAVWYTRLLLPSTLKKFTCNSITQHQIPHTIECIKFRMGLSELKKVNFSKFTNLKQIKVIVTGNTDTEKELRKSIMVFDTVTDFETFFISH